MSSASKREPASTPGLSPPVFRRRLLAWFARRQRDLPWRRSPNAYRVWVSEIMLQQTQVATVIPFYQRFLAAFPDVRALAAAPEEAVLRLWEGLGYYRRARQMLRAARRIVDERGGEFPRELHEIRDLPGIGRYTAGAIASIAYDAATPILEANTSRLLARLLAYEGDPASSAGQSLLWSAAESLLPRRGAGAFNQAMMELGSLVCSPREPRCEECPVQSHCGARRSNRENELPRARPKPSATARCEAAIVIQRGERVFLRRCGEGERWAGLWDFPRFAWTGGAKGADRELARRTRELTGLTVDVGPRLTTIKHGVTRYRITLACYRAKFLAGKPDKASAARARWIRPAQLDAYPLNSTGRQIGRLLLWAE